MKAGTIVRLPDGREGTVVYHNLDGYGIKWGRHALTMQPSGLIESADGENLEPDAMLREPYPSAEIECVGDDYEAVP